MKNVLNATLYFLLCYDASWWPWADCVTCTLWYFSYHLLSICAISLIKDMLLLDKSSEVASLFFLSIISSSRPPFTCWELKHNSWVCHSLAPNPSAYRIMSKFFSMAYETLHNSVPICLSPSFVHLSTVQFSPLLGYRYVRILSAPIPCDFV